MSLSPLVETLLLPNRLVEIINDSSSKIYYKKYKAKTFYNYNVSYFIYNNQDREMFQINGDGVLMNGIAVKISRSQRVRLIELIMSKLKKVALSAHPERESYVPKINIKNSI